MACHWPEVRVHSLGEEDMSHDSSKAKDWTCSNFWVRHPSGADVSLECVTGPSPSSVHSTPPVISAVSPSGEIEARWYLPDVKP